MQGVIDKWNGRFGFVDAGEGQRFFFLPTTTRSEIAVGDIVNFWLDDDDLHGGLMAVDIERIKQNSITRP